MAGRRRRDAGWIDVSGQDERLKSVLDAIPDDLTTAQQLSIIEHLLVNGDGGPLWDVLSALRGPDNDNEYDKLRFTIPMRANTFPYLVDNNDEISAIFGKTANVPLIVPNKAHRVDHPLSHYYSHILQAINALQAVKPVVVNREPEREEVVSE